MSVDGAGVGGNIGRISGFVLTVSISSNGQGFLYHLPREGRLQKLTAPCAYLPSYRKDICAPAKKKPEL